MEIQDKEVFKGEGELQEMNIIQDLCGSGHQIYKSWIYRSVVWKSYPWSYCHNSETENPSDKEPKWVHNFTL